jgi:hypothetical protein
MRPHHNPPNARTKIQDVLDMLRSNKVLLDPNTRYTKAEMIAWCASWIKIYDQLQQSSQTAVLPRYRKRNSALPPKIGIIVTHDRDLTNKPLSVLI